jgi:hypothetical protein
MNPDEPLDNEQQGAPVTPSKEEFAAAVSELDGGAGKKKAEKPAPAPQGDGKLQSFYDRLKDEAKRKPLADRIGLGIARGVAQTGVNVVKTAAEVGTSILDHTIGEDPNDPKHDKLSKWEADLTKESNDKIDSLLGPKDEGVGGVVETVSNFASSAWLTAQTGAGALVGAVTGAAGVAAGTDPYKNRIADAFKGTRLQNVVTDYLQTDKNDSALETRFKSYLENVMTFYTIDKAVALVKAGAVRALAKTPAEIAAADAQIETAKNLPFDPAKHGPVKVEPTPNGQFVLSGPSSDATRLSGMIPDGPPGVQVEPPLRRMRRSSRLRHAMPTGNRLAC